MGGTPPGVVQHEQVRRSAQEARAKARRVHADAVTLLRQSRELATLIAHGDTKAGEVAFAALPMPAALVDGRGRIVAVNAAWREFAVLEEGLRVGADFSSGFEAATGETLTGDVLADLRRTRSPMQLETTIHGVPLTRVLVQIGPAALPDGDGVLVVLVDITTQHEREQRLLFEATHDPLTEVANRAWLHRALGDAVERGRRYGDQYSLIYLDLDAFKPLNDRYGHAVGDATLREVADRWQRLVRAPDLLARVGGDEFVVLVEHVTDIEDVAALTRRLCRALDEPFVIGAETVCVTVTAGATVPPVDVDPDEALALADRAMYQGKRHPR